jgi:DASH complex subunit DAD1
LPLISTLHFPIISFFNGDSCLYPQSLETVLQNINKLNRSLEEVISVGNEFSPVEALWSQFENVMAKDPDTAGDVRKEGDGEEGEGEGETEAGRDQTEVDEEEDVTEAVEK